METININITCKPIIDAVTFHAIASGRHVKINAVLREAYSIKKDTPYTYQNKRNSLK